MLGHGRLEGMVDGYLQADRLARQHVFDASRLGINHRSHRPIPLMHIVAIKHIVYRCIVGCLAAGQFKKMLSPLEFSCSCRY